MAETAGALRTTSDALLGDLETLEALEREKRELAPGDPRLVELATAVEGLARRLLGQSVRQRELSAVAHELVKNGRKAPGPSIEETPREIHLILADWRDAERRASQAGSGSAEAQSAARDIDRLREEYRSAHEAAQAGAGRP